MTLTNDHIAEIAALKAERETANLLSEALEMIVAETCEYMRINNLGNPELQQTIKQCRAALELSMTDKDGWIEWSGGECPVAADALVDVEVYDGRKYQRWMACEFDWKHTDWAVDYNIIRYRLHVCAAAIRKQSAWPFDDSWRVIPVLITAMEDE